MNQYKSSCLLDATIVFLEQHGIRINLLVQFTKHRQLVRQVGDSRTLSFVEKEVMAPRTNGGLTRGVAHDGHIHHENYEFTGVEGTTPVSVFSHILDLRSRDLDLAVYGRHALRTALRGSIPEFTYIGGQYPLSPPATAKSFT